MPATNLLILLAAAVVCLLLFTAVYFFNRLVRSRIQVREAVAGIDVQLKRRHDLLPNLAALVRGNSDYDQRIAGMLEHLPKHSDKMNLADKASLETGVGRTIRQALDAAHSSPPLLGSQSFQRLQADLVRIEEELQMARRYYNALVREHNSLCETFPSGILAAMLGIKREPFFEADEASAISPEIHA